MVEAFHENIGTLFNLPMLVDLHVAFMMFLLCYTQHLGYLFHIMFPFPSILQLYIEFDTCTIITLEKLLNARFFGGFINRLAHY
jgi:hypothetical protein